MRIFGMLDALPIECGFPPTSGTLLSPDALNTIRALFFYPNDFQRIAYDELQNLASIIRQAQFLFGDKHVEYSKMSYFYH